MIARVPAAFFGIVLGLAGLGNAWRLAALLWAYPPIVAEAILLAAAAIWAILILLYAGKWLLHPATARIEAQDGVQSCFIGLIPATAMLVAIALAPYSHATALVLFAVGLLGTLLFATWYTGKLWQGDRDPGHNTPALYLATVAGFFIAATTSAALGLRGWAAPFFGAGLFTWLAIESVLLQRLCIGSPMHPMQRPTLGIQLAPPTVGAVALLAVPDAPVMAVQMLLGYGIIQAAVTARLLPWISRHGLSAGYWAFSFGLDALALAMMRLREMGGDGPLAQGAWAAFILANAVVLVLAFVTLGLLLTGRLLPPAPVAPPRRPA